MRPEVLLQSALAIGSVTGIVGRSPFERGCNRGDELTRPVAVDSAAAPIKLPDHSMHEWSQGAVGLPVYGALSGARDIGVSDLRLVDWDRDVVGYSVAQQVCPIMDLKDSSFSASVSDVSPKERAVISVDLNLYSATSPVGVSDGSTPLSWGLLNSTTAVEARSVAFLKSQSVAVLATSHKNIPGLGPDQPVSDQCQ